MTGITDPTEEHFGRGSYGWDTSQWRRLGFIWNYSDTYEEEFSRAATIANDYFSSTAVPAGEVHVLQSIAARNAARAVTRIWIYIVRTGVNITLVHTTATVANVHTIWTGNIAMSEGDVVRALFVGCTVGDTIQMDIGGFKMLLTE